MPFSSLTLTRDDIDAFEEMTFTGTNIGGSSTLGISDNDGLMLAKAIKMFKTDILEELRAYLNDETYVTETDLLDAIYDADNEDLLKDVLIYKFLELWFAQDATHTDSYSYVKAGKYHRMYVQYLRTNLRRLSGLLPKPKSVPRVRWVSAY